VLSRNEQQLAATTVIDDSQRTERDAQQRAPLSRSGFKQAT
jgi:hypothetical protein